MTAICGGGASAAKPGYGAVVQVSTFALGALANNWPVAWAVAYAALLGAANWDLNAMCTVDPPADPGFNSTDATAMLAAYQDPLGFALASAKLGQLLQRYGWYQFCECTGGGTPAPPSPPAAPAGLPTITPGITQAATPCGTFPATTVTSTNGSIQKIAGDSSTTPETFVLLPAGATTVEVTATTHTVSGVLDQTLVTGQFGDVGRNTIATPTAWARYGPPDTTVNTVITVPATAAGFWVTTAKVNMTSGTGVQNITVGLQFFCGSGPGGLVGTPGTCQPDAATLGVLQQILGLVTLIQRQNVPFAYILSTAHTGLTGQGTLTVQGLLGLQVTITTGLTSLGTSLGDPLEYFTSSYVALGTADGFPRSKRVEHSPELWFPDDAGAMTTVGYSFAPGLVATITEVIREP